MSEPRQRHTSSTRPAPSRVARWLAAIVLGAFSAAGLAAQESSDCLVCHGDPELTIERDGRQISIFFDEELAAKGVHGSTDCIDCHVDLDGVEDFPHAAELEPARCDNCHDDSFDSIAAYLNSTHGKQLEAGNPNAPRCADCHGSHSIRKSSDPESPSHLLNIPRMCTQCHGQGGEIERAGELDHDEVVARYADTIHGPGLFAQGLTVAPVCTTCHTAHAVLPLTDAASSVHKNNVNGICRDCHAGEAQIHRGIVSPELWARPGAVPLCVDCHQPHGGRQIAYGTNMSDRECLDCHTRPEIAQTGRPGLLVAAEDLERSIHGRRLVACAQCHFDVEPAGNGHGCSVGGAKVNCGVCHDREVERFERGIHGSLRAEGEENAPNCVDCHGRHGIMESRLPERSDTPQWLREAILASPTHRRNVPDLCARCHREGAPAAVRNPEGDAQKVEHYRESIHGKGLLESGLIASANCVDCHSPHMELPPSDPMSTVSPENIVATCGRCHDGIDERFRNSIHSPSRNPDFAPTADAPGLPHCNDCHSSHEVSRTDQAAFRQNIVEQCGHCHAAITETYFDTYHGKVSTLGNTVAAQCDDCHGSHEILPASDPASSLHPGANIVATCGKCHEGSHERFTTYLPHATHDDPERYPWLYWAYHAMTWLLVGVFGFFGLHVLAWLPKSLAIRRTHGSAHATTQPARTAAPKKEYLRFTPLNRLLHRMVIVSFLALAATGMALKFSETTWAKVLVGAMGGTETAGWIHRIGAVITFAYFAIHVIDLAWRFARSGKSAYRFFLGPDSMVPSWRDVEDFVATMKWFFGLGPRPRYGKWTYWEKFDYFAVFWGVLVIGFSGLVLWFPVAATHVLPGWAINVATIIHSEEALLATGFIFSIHFFNTHMRPEKFPMDRVVFTGTMTVDELKADKPGLYDQLVASGELEKHLVDPPTSGAQRRARRFGFTALAIGIVLLILLIHGLITVGL